MCIAIFISGGVSIKGYDRAVEQELLTEHNIYLVLPAMSTLHDFDVFVDYRICLILTISDLKSDCKNCIGLCCVALPYGKSADFPDNKDGGVPCRNLRSNNLCSIHNVLRDKGFRGCVSYECFGAGQCVSQNIYNGQDWRDDFEHAEEMSLYFLQCSICMKCSGISNKR